MKTSTVKPSAPRWIMIDATGQHLGKIAVAAATMLRGKHRPSFSPHQLCGDHVVVLNAAKLALPPKKGLRKTYYRHTGFPGGLKTASLDTMMARDPSFVIEHAVKGMLPRSRLREAMLRRLHVFDDAAHPYEAQKPVAHSLSAR